LLVLSLSFVETIVNLLSRLTVAAGCHQLGRFRVRLDDRRGLRPWIRPSPIGVRGGRANDRDPENHGEREQAAATTRWDLLVGLLAPVLAIIGSVVVAASGFRILIVAIVIRRRVVGLRLLAVAIMAAVVGFGPAAKTGVFLIPLVAGPIATARIVTIALAQTRGRRFGEIRRLPRIGILIAAVSIGPGARILMKLVRRRVSPARRQFLAVTWIALAPRRTIAGSRRNRVVLSD
jgi:hypothetical protein